MIQLITIHICIPLFKDEQIHIHTVYPTLNLCTWSYLILWENRSKMASTHPTDVIIEIVGIQANTQGRSCEQHKTCGCLIEEDIILRLRKV